MFLWHRRRSKVTGRAAELLIFHRVTENMMGQNCCGYHGRCRPFLQSHANTSENVSKPTPVLIGSCFFWARSHGPQRCLKALVKGGWERSIKSVLQVPNITSERKFQRRLEVPRASEERSVKTVLQDAYRWSQANELSWPTTARHTPYKRRAKLCGKVKGQPAKSRSALDYHKSEGFVPPRPLVWTRWCHHVC